MNHRKKSWQTHAGGLVLAAAVSFVLSSAIAHAQGAEVQQRIADLKEAMAQNRQALSQYTWKEQVAVSLKGEQKKVEHFQVKMGPDGKPQKTALDSPTEEQVGRGMRRGRLRQRIVEKKKEEYEEYAERMKALLQRYIPPDKDVIQDAYSKGNLSITPGGEDVKIVIRNYVKNNDSMTIVFNRSRKQISSIMVASYLDDPGDAVNLDVQFSSLADGTGHVSSAGIDGVSKHLTIRAQNSDYRKL